MTPRVRTRRTSRLSSPGSPEPCLLHNLVQKQYDAGIVGGRDIAGKERKVDRIQLARRLVKKSVLASGIALPGASSCLLKTLESFEHAAQQCSCFQLAMTI